MMSFATFSIFEVQVGDLVWLLQKKCRHDSLFRCH